MEEENSCPQEFEKFKELLEKYKANFESSPQLVISLLKNSKKYVILVPYMNMKPDIILMEKDSKNKSYPVKGCEINTIQFLRKANIKRINDKLEEEFLLNL